MTRGKSGFMQISLDPESWVYRCADRETSLIRPRTPGRRGGRRASTRRAYSWSRPAARSDALCQSANSSFISRVSSSVGG